MNEYIPLRSGQLVKFISQADKSDSIVTWAVSGEDAHGIVDPFLEDVIEKGEVFLIIPFQKFVLSNFQEFTLIS